MFNDIDENQAVMEIQHNLIIWLISLYKLSLWSKCLWAKWFWTKRCKTRQTSL